MIMIRTRRIVVDLPIEPSGAYLNWNGTNLQFLTGGRLEGRTGK
jgi:hypothetical protein